MDVEICAQFHQCSTRSFCACRSQKRKKDDLTLFFTLSGSTREKAARKTLVKLTPWVDFINIFQAAFTLADPESA